MSVELSRKVNLVDQAYRTLRRMIVGGVLLPGQQLKIDSLAAEFGVSSSPIRQALRRLD